MLSTDWDGYNMLLNVVLLGSHILSMYDVKVPFYWRGNVKHTFLLFFCYSV